MSRLSLLLVCLFTIPASVRAQKEGMVPNPAFESWSKAKVGSAALYKVVSEFGAYKSEGTMTLKVLGAGPDKIILESSNKLRTMGQDIISPPIRQEVTKFTTAEAKAIIDSPPGKFEEGTKEITVAGKTYQAKYIKTKMTTGPTTTILTLYTSDEVPGKLLRSETDVSGGDVTGKSIVELLEIK